jgi:predicted ATPase
LTTLAALPRARLLIVGTCCEGDWIVSRRTKRRVFAAPTRILHLQPMTVDNVRHYVDARFGSGWAERVASAVHRAVAGLPYLMRIGLDRVVARGLMPPGSDGSPRPAGKDPVARALPEVVAESAAEQLDRLEPRERELLEAAAVVGREFSPSQVAFALGIRGDQTRALFAAMARRGHFIAPASERSARQDASLYRFRHPVFADVIARRAPMVRRAETLGRLGTRRALDRRRA